MRFFEEPILKISLFDEENILTASGTGHLDIAEGSSGEDFVWGEQVNANMLSE